MATAVAVQVRERRATALVLLALNVAIAVLLVLWVGGATAQTSAPATCGVDDPATLDVVEPGTCHVTIAARDFVSGTALANFNYIVNVDNSKLPSNAEPLSTESNSLIARTGGQDRTTVALPNGRYLVSVRSLDHKMWGAHFTLPADAANDGTLTVPVALTRQSADNPLPLGKIRVFVFNDNTWTNGAPDTEEPGLNGFQVELKEQTDSAVTVDYHNNPLCGGVCVTGGQNEGADAGFVEIPNLGPASYFIDVHPQNLACTFTAPGGGVGSTRAGHWTQTTTIDGGLSLFAPTEEGADGTGAPGEQLWEPPNLRTAYWFGFVCAPDNPGWPSSGPLANGTGEITGTALNWMEWAPYTTGTFGPDAVENPFVALSDASTDQTVFVGRGDATGNFDIQNVPAGDYNLAVWDEQLSYIMRFKPVHIDAGQIFDANETGDNNSIGLGVSRWFGWLDGYVYKDVNDNGQYDAGIDAPLGNTDMDQRWRDGSIKEGTFTDPDGYYVYPTAEGGALGRWIVNEQGFARFSAFPGASTHDERTGEITPSCAVESGIPPANPCVPNAEGGGLLMNQLLLEGHRATVDWGKRDYPNGTPGLIVGITYFSTTRNEFHADLQAHEDYEPAVPDVTVLLETPGPDGIPNNDDDLVVNSYVTDHWVQPNASEAPVDPGNAFSQSCNPILDAAGTDVTNQFNLDIGPNCLEVPLTGERTKEGKFDGGYAFGDYCPTGFDLATGGCTSGDPQPLVAGDYIVHVLVPQDTTDTRPCNDPTLPAGDVNFTSAKGSIPENTTGCIYRAVKEDDVNVDLGNNFEPAIPPPACVGDSFVLDQATVVARSPLHTGDQGTSPSAPLCDKKLVVLQNEQNANADFNLMTNFRTDPNGDDPGDTRTGDVAEPGRVIGQVFNDIFFERNQESHWYGEPRPIGNIPVGIYARVDTNPNVNQPFDPNKWRLIKTLTTSADGTYETILPSTETLNCPIPQGPCPGMYIAVVDDPGQLIIVDGTVSVSGNTVNGAGTRFSQIDIGDRVRIGSETRTVTAIASNTQLTVNTAWGAGATGNKLTIDRANANYNPNLLTANTPFEIWPGLTDQLDTPVDPISGTACEEPAGGTNPDPSDPARPELLQVSTPVVSGSAANTARRITISADFIGTQGPTGANGGTITLTDLRTGAITTLTRGGSLTGTNGGIVSWTPGSGSTPDTIVVQLPGWTGTGTSFRPGQYQLTIVSSQANGRARSVNGITVHLTGVTNTVTYNPNVVNVTPPPPLGTGNLQTAINNAPAGSLIVLSPGTYNENVLVWKPLKIQGLGPGGVIGAHELQGRDPEDPRFNVPGSVIDGRFFQQNFTAFDAVAASHPGVRPNFTSGAQSVVLRGADITVNAQNTTAYDLATGPAGGIFTAARIDGLGLQTGHGDGAGGVQLQASVNNMQITNNVLENNAGIFAGGIGVGQPFVHGSHNYNVRVANDRLIGNGGLTSSGGMGIFYGSNNYEVARSVLCANFGVEYGGGLSHIGLSPGGSIHDNRIYYNESVDSGGGIAIEGELVVGGGTLSDGSGAVNVDRNLIQSNTSTLDDGGGIFVLDALKAEINIRNNMIVNNLAADLGGAIMLDDASNVRIVNNTVADNVTTGSSENSAIGTPHGAGLTSEANDPLFQATLPAGAPDFSNPVALFNNIFWNNNAMTLSQFGPGATLVDNGFIDFEIHGAANGATFTPRYSDLTNGQILGPDGQLHALPGGQANISADPLFVAPFVLELAVSGSRLDPQQAAVSITGQDPPVGLTGDYHIGAGSPAIDRGAGFSTLAAVAPANQTPVVPPAILAPCSGNSAQLTAMVTQWVSVYGLVGLVTFPTAQLQNVGPAATVGYPGDYDGQWRPQTRTNRVRTPWDIGADELPSLPTLQVTIPKTTGTPQFNWNNPNPPCSGSTVP